MEVWLAVTGGVLWLIGGNVIVALHYHRRGMPWWSGFRPWTFPFRHLNTWEWLALLLLATASLALMGLGLRPEQQLHLIPQWSGPLARMRSPRPRTAALDAHGNVANELRP